MRLVKFFCAYSLKTMFKKKCVLFIIIILIFTTELSDSSELSRSEDLAGPRIVCNYASWTALAPGIRKLTRENIDPNLCTHIIYEYGEISDQTTFIPFNERIDIDHGGYANITGLKAQNADLKTMLALRVSNEGYANFSFLAGDSTTRSMFIENSIKYLRGFDFDGLDLQWQLPDIKYIFSFLSLLQELQEIYKSESKHTGKPRLLLSITLPNSRDHIMWDYDVSKLTKYVDWMNVLTYKYKNQLQSLINHHSQLYGMNNNSNKELNANSTIAVYLETRVESGKLVLGVPTFGLAYNLYDSTNVTDIGLSAFEAYLRGIQSNKSEILSYYEICKRINDGGWIVNQPYPNEGELFAYKDNQWMSYNDENIIKIKAQYVVKKKLGGIMFWFMQYDDSEGYCSGETFPLIRAARDTLSPGWRFPYSPSEGSELSGSFRTDFGSTPKTGYPSSGSVGLDLGRIPEPRKSFEGDSAIKNQYEYIYIEPETKNAEEIIEKDNAVKFENSIVIQNFLNLVNKVGGIERFENLLNNINKTITSESKTPFTKYEHQEIIDVPVTIRNQTKSPSNNYFVFNFN